MTVYNGKSIFSTDLTIGNKYREEYLGSINSFIEKKYAETDDVRSEYMKDIVGNQEKYREEYIKMLGQPVLQYPDHIPGAKWEHMGMDDFCNIYYVQIETMPDFWFFGVFMVPFNARKAPLVIAQHGGGSAPEICSEFLGESNYSYFTKRALEKGFAVFAPQLLLWDFKHEFVDESLSANIPYRRDIIDNKLKHLGLSITGLEVFCIRRSLDYINSLDYIDENRTGMMGLSYGGYFSLYTAAADKRIKSIYAAGFFNDRTKIAFGDWQYKNAANTFCDAEIIALCAPRRLQIDVGKDDPVFDFEPSINESERAISYYKQFGAETNFRFTLWNGGHRFDKSGEGFEFFFGGI